MDHQSKPPLPPGLGSNSGGILATSSGTDPGSGVSSSPSSGVSTGVNKGLRAPSLLYLASQSPRRRELLAQIGVTPVLLLPDDDEDAEALEVTRAGESARNYVERVTRAKAHAANLRWQRHGLPPAPILCADTTVTIDGQILGKPADAADATRILRLLSGRTHQVLTAVTLSVPGTPRVSANDPDGPMSAVAFAISVSRVRFGVLDDHIIQCYVDTGEPFGKAGAYGIQGHGAALIAHLDGSYSGVMGLPLFETAQLLRHME